MKKFAKIIAFVVTLAMVCCLAGCSGSDGKTLKIATNAEFEPFEFLNENNEIIGFDVDMMNEIAKRAGYELDWKNMEFDGVVAAVPAGTCDIAVSGLTITPKRAKTVDFTDSYMEAAQILIVRTDDTTFTGTTKAELDNQLKNKKVGVCTGYTGELYAKGDADLGFTAIEGAEVKVYDSPATAITDLKNGQIDVIILDDAVAKENAAADVNKNSIKVIDVALTVEKYAIAVKKGNTELLNALNKALREMKEDGTLDQLLTKWELK